MTTTTPKRDAVRPSHPTAIMAITLVLLLSSVNSVHAAGMTYVLDVASMDDAGRVVHVSCLHPFAIIAGVTITWSSQPVSVDRADERR